MFKKGKLCLAICSLIASAGAYSAPGDLDNTFGTSGVLDVPSCTGVAKTIPTSDGLLLAGTTSAGDGFVKKYDSNGLALDTTFGNAGVADLPRPVGGYSLTVLDAETLYNGKIAVLALARSTNVVYNDIYVAMLLPNGSLDAGFNDGRGYMSYSQYVSVEPEGPKEDRPEALEVLPDGRLIVGSTSNVSPTTNITFTATMTRIRENGTFDTSVPKGRAVFLAGSLVDIALSPDLTTFGVISGNKIKKLPAPGTSGVNFGTSGVYTLNIGTGTVIQTAVVQADGKLLVSGRKGSNAFIARLNPTGASPLDTTYGNGAGYVEFDSPILKDEVLDIAAHPSGETVAAGYSSLGTTVSKDLLTFKADTTGALVTSFGVNGFAHYDHAGAQDSPNRISIQADGKVIIPAATYVGPARLCSILRYEI
jgi:uncharacterized delta-60 repeat protein